MRPTAPNFMPSAHLLPALGTALLGLLLGLAPAASHASATTASPAVAQPAKGGAKTGLKSSAKPNAAPAYAEPEELDAERMAVVPQVLQGESRCDANESVHVQSHPTLLGRFLLRHRGKDYVMTPHPTSTGVVRLEDRRQGFVWLQVPVKSMLMDSRRGQRVADACMHPEQSR